MPKEQNSTKNKEKILKKSLETVIFDGWTEDLLETACKQAKISKKSAESLFPCGTLDIALYFSEWADQEMLKKLKKHNLDDMRVRDRIALGVRTRLEVLEPYKMAVSGSLKFFARPDRGLYLPKLVWATADKIWEAAGDESTDYNHYSKRSLLSGVLSTTTLFWINDMSENHEKSWAFLNNRIDNVLKLGQVIGRIKKKSAC